MNMRRIAAGALALLMTAAGSLAEWQEESKNGKVVRRVWLDGEGKAAAAPEGYASVNFSYSGRTVTEKYYTLAGTPAQAVGGYYGRMLTYGNKHRVEEIIYLDQDGHKANNREGYARVKIAYTSAGGVTGANYYDENGSAFVVPGLGYAQLRNEYRGTTLTRSSYYDADKKLTDLPSGYAVMVQKVNKSNRVLSVYFEHADGRAAQGPDGWAMMDRDVDKKNREVSRRYFDLAGQLTDRGLGYGWEEMTWESDQVCVIRRVDLQGNPMTVGEGFAALRREMNRDGQVIRETWLGENGSAKEDSQGVASRKYEYDSQGRISRVTFEGARGDRTENSAGYGGYEDRFDADGFVTARVFLSKGGKAVNTVSGYSEIRYTYDEMKQISATEYYDTNGNLVRKE